MYVFLKKVTLLIIAKQHIQYRPAASLRYSTTQFVVVSLCCVKKRNHYSVIQQSALSDSYLGNIIKCSTMLASKNDQSKWSLSFRRGSRVEGSISRVEGTMSRVIFFFNFFIKKMCCCCCCLIKIVRGHSNSLKSKEPSPFL